MSLRKVFEHAARAGDAHVVARVYRDAEWQEYRVRLYVNGELQPAADAFETDKAAAIGTAYAFVEQRVTAAKPPLMTDIGSGFTKTRDWNRVLDELKHD